MRIDILTLRIKTISSLDYSSTVKSKSIDDSIMELNNKKVLFNKHPFLNKRKIKNVDSNILKYEQRRQKEKEEYDIKNKEELGQLDIELGVAMTMLHDSEYDLEILYRDYYKGRNVVFNILMEKNSFQVICIVKPEIYLKENNVFQVSFCDSKYYTQMRYDSLNVLKDFVGENAVWEPFSSSPYDMIVSDSLIVLKSRREYSYKILFYVEKKEWCKDCPLEKDVSMYVPLPFGYVNSSECHKRKPFSF